MEKITLIRLIFGLTSDDSTGGSSTFSSGLQIIYENPDGLAGELNFIINCESVRKIRFIDRGHGESRIVWEKVQTGIIFKSDEWQVKEIFIYRDWQSN